MSCDLAVSSERIPNSVGDFDLSPKTADLR